MSNNFNELFSQIKISELPKPEKIIEISMNKTLLEAAEILFENKIQAAPVFDPAVSVEASWSERYVGMVDLIGIVSGVISSGHQEPHQQFINVLKSQKNLTEKKVADVMGTWMNAPFVPVEESYSLLDAMLLLSKYQVHRLPVVGKNHEIVNIITQTTIVRILQKNRGALAAVGQKSLEELGLNTPAEVLTVPINSITMDAFKLIADNHIGAVGILGENKMLIGTVSASDIRTLTHYPELFGVLSQNLRIFLEAARMHQPNVMNPAIRCFGADTLEHVIDILAATKVHRIFVIGHNGQPVRVVSLSDVIGKYVEEPKEYFGNYFVNGVPAGRPGL